MFGHFQLLIDKIAVRINSASVGQITLPPEQHPKPFLSGITFNEHCTDESTPIMVGHFQLLIEKISVRVNSATVTHLICLMGQIKPMASTEDARIPPNCLCTPPALSCAFWIQLPTAHFGLQILNML